MTARKLNPKYIPTDDEVSEALQRPQSFMYFGDKDMFETWALGPVIQTRDSDLLTRSNAIALKRHLESDPTLAPFYSFERCSHWGPGWVEHISFRALTKPLSDGGKPTRIFAVLLEWFKELEDYPVADEDIYTEMQLDEWHEAVSHALRYLQRRDLIRELSEDEEYKLRQRLGEYDNDPDSVRREMVLEAAKYLGYLVVDEAAQSTKE